MFSVNSYAKIKTMEDKGSYAFGRIVISRKIKQTGEYETSFISKVKFVGKAYNQKPQEGQRIKITSCAVQNCYNKDNELKFLSEPNYTIFDYELQEDNNGSTENKKLVLAPIDDSELPF